MQTFTRAALWVGVGIAAVIVTPHLNAADGDAKAGKSRQAAAEIPWPSAWNVAQPGARPSPSLQSLVVRGDPNEQELYSIMYKAGPGTKLTAHSHPDERSCFVLEGTWYFGYGEKWNDAGLKALPAGSHYSEPANAPHFAGTRDGTAVVECTAVGPSDTKSLE